MTIALEELRERPLVRAASLLAALALLVAVRVGLGGQDAPGAFLSGAVFGAALILVAVAVGAKVGRPGTLGLTLGLVGGLTLIAIPTVAGPGVAALIGLRPEPFLAWAAVTVLVAGGEEMLLRGALHDALAAAAGPLVAVAFTGLAFALLHVPLYGWQVVPLDLAVGIFLGGLRLASGGVAAPAVAHALADLATWWL